MAPKEHSLSIGQVCSNDMVVSGYLRNEFNFWKVHGIMNTSGLVQSK